MSAYDHEVEVDVLKRTLQTLMESVWSGEFIEGLATKVDKVDGKGLSTHDLTTALLDKLLQIEPQATRNALDSVLRDRRNHTHTQPIATIEGLQAALDSKQGSGASASSADRLTTARTLSMTGDGTWSVSFNGAANVTNLFSLADVNASVGWYGDAVEVPILQVDSKGRIRAISSAPIPAGDSATAGLLRISSSLTNTSTTIAASVGAIKQVKDLADTKVSNSAIGTTVCPLSGGLIPTQYLPSFVDDVLEFTSFAALPVTGESGKLYITLNDNATYRWSGSQYIKINDSVSTADAATRLATARTISMTGDGTWSVSFDGSSNRSGAFTLSNSGIVAGSYAKPTFDSKGRAIGSVSLVDTDIPNLPASKITSGTVAVARLPTVTASTAGVVRVTDHLDSTAVLEALSANMGRILKEEMIAMMVGLQAEYDDTTFGIYMPGQPTMNGLFLITDYTYSTLSYTFANVPSGATLSLGDTSLSFSKFTNIGPLETVTLPIHGLANGHYGVSITAIKDGKRTVKQFYTLIIDR